MSERSHVDFALDPRIAATTLALAETTTSLARMMNDRRYPWIVLVPRHPNAVELFDLPAPLRHALADEAASVAARMAKSFSAEKINIATLGNKVRQFHLHIVARRIGDAAWPDGVWNGTAAEPFDDPAQLATMRARLQACVEPPR